MGQKYCKRCGKIKPTSQFSRENARRDGRQPYCKACCSEYASAYRKRQDNPVSVGEKLCQRCEEVKVASEFGRDKQVPDGLRKWCKNCTSEYKKEYNKNHPYWRTEKAKEWSRKYQANRLRNDPQFRLRQSMSHLITRKLRIKGSNFPTQSRPYKSKIAHLPYTIDELMVHLESLFRPGMTWDNYGEWHIDHVKPDHLFAYSSPEDFEFGEAWALENLQPLWAEENFRKRGFYEPRGQIELAGFCPF